MPAIETCEPYGRPVRLKKLCAIRLPYLFLLILLAAGAGFYVEENWRGPRVFWKRYAELEAHGERMKVEQFQVPAVPVEQNFMMSEAWGGVLKSREPWKNGFPSMLRMPHDKQHEWETVKLADWVPWEDGIQELAKAAETASFSVFPSPPGDENSLVEARGMCESLFFRARAAQREENSAAAAQSLRIMFRLHEAFAGRAILHNQLLAVALAGLTRFTPSYETAWSRKESEMIAAGLRQMDRLPDFALALRYDRADCLRLLVDKEGNLPRPPAGNWFPRGWTGLAYTWWLDFFQYRIEEEEAWPAVIRKPDPLDSQTIWQGFTKVGYAGRDLSKTRQDCLDVQIHLVLARFEHAFGWYRREHGRDIDHPEELRPYLAGAWPTDPYTGKPHIIEAEGKLWCIRWNVKGEELGPDDVWRFPLEEHTRLHVR